MHMMLAKRGRMVFAVGNNAPSDEIECVFRSLIEICILVFQDVSTELHDLLNWVGRQPPLQNRGCDFGDPPNMQE